ncbi:MAG: hypothetical protein Q9M50_08040 [Methylococcales bacterium]|nr:hypothetical protein [Methylococcales bacterium]
MKKVASLRYGVIFKKAFCDVDVFKGFVRDILGINLEIDQVETEKSFKPSLGRVEVKYNLYADDKKIVSSLIFNTHAIAIIITVFYIIIASPY